jgi:hypothetical protein
MALLGTAIAFIGKIIADNAKKREDANQAAIDQTNALMSAEDNYYANKRKNDKETIKSVEEAQTQRVTTTREFLENDPRGKGIIRNYINNVNGLREGAGNIESAENNKKVQELVQRLISAEMKKNPAAAPPLKDTTFSGPQGFSNVIGVGANPVLENMTRQTDIQQQILEFLKSGVQNPNLNNVDFTKRSTDLLPQ